MADDPAPQTTVVNWPRRVVLTRMERDAMRELKRHVEEGIPFGRKRIVSMQELEKAGLVERVTANGLIRDWKLTSAGEEWKG